MVNVNPARLAEQIARFARSQSGRVLDAAHAANQGLEYSLSMLHPERGRALRMLQGRSPNYEHAIEVNPATLESGSVVTDLDPHGVGIPQSLEGAEVHHTHPGRFSPLSIQDLMAAYARGLESKSQSPDARAVYAHQTNNTGGSVARWSDAAMQRQKLARFGRAIDAANIRINDAMFRGHVVVPDIRMPLSPLSQYRARGASLQAQIANLALMRALRRSGLLDRFGYAPLTRRQQRLLRRFEPQIERLARIAARPLRAIHPDIYWLRYPFTPTNLMVAGGAVAGAGAALGQREPKRNRQKT